MKTASSIHAESRLTPQELISPFAIAIHFWFVINLRLTSSHYAVIKCGGSRIPIHPRLKFRQKQNALEGNPKSLKRVIYLCTYCKKKRRRNNSNFTKNNNNKINSNICIGLEKSHFECMISVFLVIFFLLLLHIYYSFSSSSYSILLHIAWLDGLIFV